MNYEFIDYKDYIQPYESKSKLDKNLEICQSLNELAYQLDNEPMSEAQRLILVGKVYDLLLLID